MLNNKGLLMKTKKITLLTSIGAGLEYYDFIIYALLAGYIAKQFFPEGNYYVGIMGAFCIFALGYFVRPFGGVVFGMFGDRFGRKKPLLASILLMAFSTVFIGLLPTYKTIGLSATVIFTLFRILQGLSFGAELPGSLTFLTEHAENKSRGKSCSFMIASVGLGVMVGSFVIYVISKILTSQQMFDWGWRIPFLIGGLLAIAGYFIRKQTVETPFFTKMHEKNQFALLELLKNNFWQVVNGIGIIIFPASFVIFVLTMPVYLHQMYNYSMADIYIVIVLGHVWSSLLIPIFGWVSDKVDRRMLLFFPAIVVALFGYFLFEILKIKSFFALLVFMLLYQLIVAVMASSYFVMLAENFPTKVRFTGIAFCYNVAYALAALIPLAVEYLYKTSQNKTSGILSIFVILALITSFSALKMKNHMKDELA
jgi:MHS family proline/betaine transporter-like MFS transporter